MFLLITILAIYYYLSGKKYAGLILFFFLLTDGFQFVPPPIMLWGLNMYGKDYALIFIVAIFFSHLITGRLKIYLSDPVRKWVLIFGAYLLIAIAVDIPTNPSISGLLLVVRNYFFIIAFFVFDDVSNELWERIARFLLRLMVVQCMLCLLQLLIGIPLLTAGGVTPTYELGFRWFRYTNLPFFIYSMIYIVMLIPKARLRYKNQILFLFIITILFTLTRTLILGLFITIFIAIFTGVMASAKRVIPLMMVIILLTLPLIGPRLISSFGDIGNTFQTNFETPADNTLTFTWRMALTAERMIYVNETNRRKIFGIGFVHEKDFGEPIFLVGHLNDDGIPVQLDQGDIAWPNLFLHLGFVGTFLYCMIAISLGRFYFRHKHNFVASAAFMYLTYSFIITFAGNSFSSTDFFIIPFIMYFYVRRSTSQTETRFLTPKQSIA